MSGGGYSDVPANHPHREGIEWATANGFMSGYFDGTFRPERSLTRGQFATVLYRMFGAKSAVAPAAPAEGTVLSTATVTDYVTVTYPEGGGDPVVTDG